MVDLSKWKKILSKKYDPLVVSFLSPVQTFGLMAHLIYKNDIFYKLINNFSSIVENIYKNTDADFCFSSEDVLELRNYLKKHDEITVAVIAQPDKMRSIYLVWKLLVKGYENALKKIESFPLKKDDLDIEISYKEVKIPKNSGKEYRTLLIPNKKLKKLQRVLLNLFYSMRIKFPYAYGFEPGKSAYKNACVHSGAKQILKLDIKDAFDSINVSKVLVPKLIKLFGKYGAEFIVKYCTYNNALPQGAPTSGWLLNLALNSFDLYIAEVCRRYGLKYSRYADDICISTTKKKRLRFEEIKEIVEERLSLLGLELNDEKTKILRNRLSVTGYILNTGKPTISRKIRRIYRAMLHNHLTGKKPLSEQVINGIKSYVGYVHPNYLKI